VNDILEYLDVLFPNPQCELSYKKDYELLIAVVLSAQTTDKKVNSVTSVLFRQYPSLEDLDKAELDDVKEIIKPIGTFNKKALFIKQIVNSLIVDHKCKVPKTHKELEKLPGVGHKTANVVLGVLYNIPTFAVDTHVSRVSKRLKLVNEKDDVVAMERKLKKKIDRERWIKTHHQLVLFGRYYCKAIKPKCHECKLNKICKGEIKK